MSNEAKATAKGPTRRGFLGSIASLACVGVGWKFVSAAGDPEVRSGGTPPGRRVPVVSVHLDEPYLDRTGTHLPYEPARVCGGARLAGLPEAVMRRHHCYL